MKELEEKMMDDQKQEKQDVDELDEKELDDVNGGLSLDGFTKAYDYVADARKKIDHALDCLKY